MPTDLERLIHYRRHVGRLDPIELQPLPAPEVRLTVVDGEIPRSLPPHLDGTVRWSESLDDWTLLRLGVAGLEPYLTWRATWESSFTLGTLATVREFRLAAQRARVDAQPDGEAVLHRLLADPVNDVAADRFDLAELRALQSLVAATAYAVRASGEHGVALVESSPTVRRTGLLRSWPADVSDGELAARGTATVRFSGSRLGVWFADDRDPIVDVRSFELGVSGAFVVDADGVEHVLEPDATEALCAVAPDATAWRVRRMPAILVFADLIAAVDAAVDAVERSGTQAVVRHGDLRHTAITLAS